MTRSPQEGASFGSKQYIPWGLATGLGPLKHASEPGTFTIGTQLSVHQHEFNSLAIQCKSRVAAPYLMDLQLCLSSIVECNTMCKQWTSYGYNVLPTQELQLTNSIRYVTSHHGTSHSRIKQTNRRLTYACHIRSHFTAIEYFTNVTVVRKSSLHIRTWHYVYGEPHQRRTSRRIGGWSPQHHHGGFPVADDVGGWYMMRHCQWLVGWLVNPHKPTSIAFFPF